jgi:hypothetical protein
LAGLVMYAVKSGIIENRPMANWLNFVSAVQGK